MDFTDGISASWPDTAGHGCLADAVAHAPGADRMPMEMPSYGDSTGMDLLSAVEAESRLSMRAWAVAPSQRKRAAHLVHAQPLLRTTSLPLSI